MPSCRGCKPLPKRGMTTPDWHGRDRYVQVLLAIASLSCVIEWWEAERETVLEL